MKITKLTILQLATEQARQNWLEARKELEKDPNNHKFMTKEWLDWEVYKSVFGEFDKEYSKRYEGK